MNDSLVSVIFAVITVYLFLLTLPALITLFPRTYYAQVVSRVRSHSYTWKEDLEEITRRASQLTGHNLGPML